MDLLTLYFVICGIAANAWIGWHVGRALGQIAGAALCAFSFCRFAVAVMRVRGRSRRYIAKRLPGIWINHFLSELSCDKMTVSGPSGSWSGYGNWHVHGEKERAM